MAWEWLSGESAAVLAGLLAAVTGVVVSYYFQRLSKIRLLSTDLSWAKLETQEVLNSAKKAAVGALGPLHVTAVSKRDAGTPPTAGQNGAPTDGALSRLFGHMERDLERLGKIYDVSRTQMTQAFKAALGACIAGIILFALGMWLGYTSQAQSSLIPLISVLPGAVVEIVAGSFFVLHARALRQINRYHDHLIQTQRVATGIAVAEGINGPIRDEVHAQIAVELILAGAKVDGSIAKRPASYVPRFTYAPSDRAEANPKKP